MTTSNRRIALATPYAVLPAIAAVAAEPSADPHPAWYAEWRELLHWSDAADTEGRDAGDFPERRRSEELEELIACTPAATLPGVHAQLALLHRTLAEARSFGDRDVDLLANALATVERLTGENVT